MGDLAPWPSVKTRRLTLRAPRAEDAPRMARLADDFEIARMTTRIPHPFTVEQAEDFIARTERRDRSREAVFVIESEQDGLIGVLGLDPGPAGTEIGYWLGRPFWGAGYATEAARAALAWARADWGRRFVVAGHFTDNPASGAVLVKAGFLYTGEVAIRHSMARGEDAATRMMVWLA
ncbi:MAG: GNAT family N-acetyltransferase [Caulobacteraceae bacterium]